MGPVGPSKMRIAPAASIVRGWHAAHAVIGSPAIFRKKWRGVRDRFRADPFVLRRVYTTLEEGLLSPHLDRLQEGARIR